MKEKYILKDAIIFNPTGKKYNAVAKIATHKEIRQHKEYFNFNFEKNYKEATIYKITKEHDEDLIHGFVSVKPNTGVLDCGTWKPTK